MRALVPIIIVAIGLLQSGCKTQSMPTPEEPLPVSYSVPSPESLKRLNIQKIAIDDSLATRIARLSKMNSPWGSRTVICDPADTSHEGPWTTRLYIFTGTNTDHCISVEARDHASGGVEFSWLSDKALFIRCWWGRIASTDFVLDTETTRPVYIEDADYLKLTLPPEP
jgi:hypothetical protein